MNGKSSYETSWADQWDPEPTGYSTHPSFGRQEGDGGAKKKVEEGLVKAKEAAAAGAKKVKQGAAVGFLWIKDKYNKTTQKH